MTSYNPHHSLNYIQSIQNNYQGRYLYMMNIQCHSYSRILKSMQMCIQFHTSYCTVPYMLLSSHFHIHRSTLYYSSSHMMTNILIHNLNRMLHYIVRYTGYRTQ